MSPEETILFLENSTPNEVYNYFEKKNKFVFKLKHPLIQKFIKKGDKLILMALAKFSHDFETVKFLYSNSKDVAIRVAALSNDKKLFNFFFYSTWATLDIKEMKKFLKKASNSELKAYFQNKHFSEDPIFEFLEKKSPFDDLEEEKYKNILLYLLNNPNRISKYGMGNMPMDGVGGGLTWHANYRVANLFPKVFKKYFPKAIYDLEKLIDVN